MNRTLKKVLANIAALGCAASLFAGNVLAEELWEDTGAAMEETGDQDWVDVEEPSWEETAWEEPVWEDPQPEDVWTEPEVETETTTEEETIPRVLTMVNGSIYEDIGAAMQAAMEMQEPQLQLLQDISVTAAITLTGRDNKTLTIDLNGYNVYLYGSQDQPEEDHTAAFSQDAVAVDGGCIRLRNISLKVIDSAEEKESWELQEGQRNHGSLISKNTKSPMLRLYPSYGETLQVEISAGSYQLPQEQKIFGFFDAYEQDITEQELSQSPGNGESGSGNWRVVVNGGKFQQAVPQALIGAGFEQRQGDDAYWEIVEGEPETEALSYVIRWINWDETILAEDSVTEGEYPVYFGETPTREEDESYTYEFAGWTPEMEAVYQDADYYASYTATPKEPEIRYYTVNWMNQEQLLYSVEVQEGMVPVYNGETPSSPLDPEAYEFIGWDPQPAELYEDISYYAVYQEIETTEPETTEPETTEPETTEPETTEPETTEPETTEPETTEPETTEPETTEPETKQYVILWQNWDGALLEKDIVADGEIPSYDSTYPTREADDNYRYEFDGWNKLVTAAHEDTTYTAVFLAIPRVHTYTIRWENYDGSLLGVNYVREGQWPRYYGYTPTRPSDGQYSYVFNGWQQKIERVWYDRTYTASYQAIPIITQYQITWLNYDGTVLKTDMVNNGVIPAYTGNEPKKAATQTESYEFIGWDQEILPADQDMVYRACFKSVPIFEESSMKQYSLLKEEVQEYPIYFEKGKSEIPYINLARAFQDLEEIYQKSLGDESVSFNITFEREGEHSLLLVERENGSRVIVDFTANLLVFTDYAGFSRCHKGLSESQAALVRSLEQEIIYPSVDADLWLSLDDYDLHIYEIGDTGYMPLATFSDLFLLPLGINWVYGGENSYLLQGDLTVESLLESASTQFNDEEEEAREESILDFLKTALGMKLAETIEEDEERLSEEQRALLIPEVRSKEQAEFTYHELCLILDLNYGKKEDLGITKGFDDFFRQVNLYNLLTDTDMKKFQEGLDKLSEDYFANTLQEEAENSYEEIGNTAYLKIQKFAYSSVDLTDEEVKAQASDYLQDDVLALIIYANGQIKREGSPITRVVLDLRNAGGGNEQAAAFVVSWMLGKADITTKDMLSETYHTISYVADVNLDGIIDDQDNLSGGAYELYCLVGSGTRDAGNLVASLLKISDKVALVGQTTGGGAFNQLYYLAPGGANLQFAGLSQYHTVKAGSYLSIAAGVDADIYVKDLKVLEDREALEEILDSIR